MRGWPLRVAYGQVVNWAEVGAIAGIVAIIEAPILLLFGYAWRWVRDINDRLTRIEARTWQRRRTDPPPRLPSSNH